MRISLNWLQELVDITLSPEELASTLTMAGFEVEEIIDRRSWANGVVIGKIIDRQAHPNADKLSVCQVDIGANKPLNIVCGAPNARADIFVPVATIGTYLPQIDLKIKPAKLRGVPSEGMICSLAELGLTKESAGIHIFTEENLTLGSDVRPLLGLDDVIFDLTSTANRADALSMVGIAREVAALTNAKLKLPAITKVAFSDNTNVLKIKVSENKACPTYIGTVIKDVKIAPSPNWLKQKLEAAGIRPINNVVDITNYILLEWGQPLHAFDQQKLQGLAGGNNLQIGVRFANSGESLKTLDDQTRNLTPQNLLITVNDHPIALAGVMGGENTEVDSNTQNIVLEAALFDSVAIRRSARSQGLRTEASTRYERGVNMAELELACNRAIALISDLAQGSVISQVMADYRSDSSTWSNQIKLRLSRVNQVLGPIYLGEEVSELSSTDVERILTALGCELTSEGEDIWNVKVPPYRYKDLEREIDLIEEVARLYGYDNFCDNLPQPSEFGYLSLEQSLTRKLRQAFLSTGLTEVMHYSLVKQGGEKQVVLNNPLFIEYSALRTDLIAALIDAYQYNIEQGNGALNGFEIGRIFSSEEIGLEEYNSIAGIMGGDQNKGIWTRSGKEQPLTWYEAKGILESVFQRLNIPVEYQPDLRDERLHPGRTASLWIKGERLGTFGQLHPELIQSKGLPESSYVFEMNLDVILVEMSQNENLVPVFANYSTYPALDRDLAFFAASNVSLSEINKVVKKAAGNLLESVELFDEYRGKNVPEGQRSLALRLVYRTSDRTLSDADVDPIHQKVRDALIDKFNVNLRS